MDETQRGDLERPASPGIVIRRVEKPDADASAAAGTASMRDLEAMVELANAFHREAYGDDDLAETAEQWRIDWTRPSSWGQRYWVAELAEGDSDPARIVGYAQADLDEQDDLALAYVSVVVGSPWRRRGVGRALAEAALADLRAGGRTRLESWCLHDADGDEWLEAPSGQGRVPADDAVSRFALGFGLGLGQVVRVSALDFDDEGRELERLAELRDAAADTAGQDYRVLAWTAPSPEERLDDLAALAARMSTDEPSGELERVARTFDAERIRRNEARSIEKGTPLRYAVVEHVPSGRIVAQNVLKVDLAHPERRAHQEDTLVLPEHRGHRLGWLVKTEGLLRLRAEHPEARGVITWNAEENRPMLAVNEQVGFRPIGYEGAWHGAIPVPGAERQASGEPPAAAEPEERPAP